MARGLFILAVLLALSPTSGFRLSTPAIGFARAGFATAGHLQATGGGDEVLPPADPTKVVVLPDAEAVGADVFEYVEAAALEAIAARGAFALAIPGGSVLSMLAGTAPAWADKCTVAYVNHKCVAMDDAELATHAKATSLFLNQWEGVDVVTLNGSGDAPREAEAYEAALRERVAAGKILTSSSSGGGGGDGAPPLPVFDLMLVGVGDDGHVGSLYPGRGEVLDRSGAWVLPVEMKTPGSITLSLDVMAAAKETVIAACGVSAKYPQGKSAGMLRAVEGAEMLSTFPAAGLRKVATWVMDEAAASKLSPQYLEL